MNLSPGVVSCGSLFRTLCGQIVESRKVVLVQFSVKTSRSRQHKTAAATIIIIIMIIFKQRSSSKKYRKRQIVRKQWSLTSCYYIFIQGFCIYGLSSFCCCRTIPLWSRNVDDTFTAVHNDEIDNFYEHLNRRNADILHLHLTCTAYPSHLRIIGWVGLQKD